MQSQPDADCVWCRGENVFQHWIFLSSQWGLFAQNIILFLPLFLVSCLFTMFIKYFPGLTPPGCYVHLHSGPGEISPGSSTTQCQRLIIFIGGAGLWSRSVLLGPLLSWPDTSGVTQVTGHHWSHPHTSFSPASPPPVKYFSPKQRKIVGSQVWCWVCRH